MGNVHRDMLDELLSVVARRLSAENQVVFSNENSQVLNGAAEPATNLTPDRRFDICRWLMTNYSMHVHSPLLPFNDVRSPQPSKTGAIE